MKVTKHSLYSLHIYVGREKMKKLTDEDLEIFGECAEQAIDFVLRRVK